MELFDSHCHIHIKGLLSFINIVKRNNEKVNVKKMMCNATRKEDFDILKTLHSDSILISLGVHPYFVEDGKLEENMKILKTYLIENPIFCIGEIGLDKFNKYIPMSLQTQYFESQLLLAKELNRPVSIHCVQSYGTLLDIIKSHIPYNKGILLHSFNGSIDITKRFINELNNKGNSIYFSFSSMKTSIKKYNYVFYIIYINRKESIKEIIKIIPLNRLLIETDSPDGIFDNMCYSDIIIDNKIMNQPSNIITICNEIANILNKTPIEISQITYKNALDLFTL